MGRYSRQVSWGGFVVFTLLFVGTATRASSIADACADVRRQLAAERQQFKEEKDGISEARRKLRGEMAAIQSEIRATNAKIIELEENADDLNQKIQLAEQRLFEEEQTMTRLFETVSFNLHEFYRLYSQSFSKHPEFQRSIDNLANSSKSIPDLIRALEVGFGCYDTYFDKSTSIQNVNGDFFARSGELVAARVLSVGLIGGNYWNESGYGIAYSRPGSDRWHLEERGLTHAQQAALAASKDRSGGIVPVHLDLTDGMALEQLQLQKDWKGFIKSGGFVMYPLMLIACIAALMIIERGARYSLYTASFAMMKRRLLQRIRDREIEAASKLARSHLGASRRFWRKAMELVEKPPSQVDDAFQHIIISELPGIERFLSSLAVFAAICPLLGLLGTVSGMIKTFDIITLYGTGNSAMLSQGISEALVTTQVGLVLAIPILLAHSMLAKSARSIVGRMDQAVAEIIAGLGMKENNE